MVRVSASALVDSGLITRWVKSMVLKLVFTTSPLDTQHERDSVKNKPASSPVVPLGKALGGIFRFWCGRQMAGISYASSL